MKSCIICFLLIIFPSVLLSQEGSNNFFKSEHRHKISPLITGSNVKNFEDGLRVVVNDISNFKMWAQKSAPDIDVVSTKYENIFEVSGLNPDRIKQLLDCKWVDFVDVSNRKAKEERTIENSDLTVNKIFPVHYFFPSISGEGLVVSVKEQPFDTTDIDLRGRIIGLEPTSEIPTLHATFMATFIAGAGNSAPKGKGAASGALLTSSSYNNLMPDDGQHLRALNVSVQNHSYGVTEIENYYGIEAMEYDKHCLNYPEIMHVFSSGNIGLDTSKTGIYAGIPNFANLTGQFKMSKNTISVGAIDLNRNVAILSSRGPAYDGRIKPELVAYGDGGTSDAAALISGICLLVQDAYKQSGNQDLPPSSLVKATIINSADDVGRAGIDYESGYGSADAYGAVKTMMENRFFNSACAKGEEKVFNISVPANAYNLKVTLVWTDPEAEVNSPSALVNDLDLEVFQTSTGSGWKPWVLSAYPHPDSLVLPAKRTKDHLNNVEQVTISSPENGNYEIHVFGGNIVEGSQNFSIAWEYECGFDWIYPLKNSQLELDKPIQISWQLANASGTGTLEYKMVGNDAWNMISNNVELSQSYFNWTPMDITGLAMIRLKTTDTEFFTDTFLISTPISLKVAYNCDDETLINWDPVSGADEYKLSFLGEKYLETFRLTNDTFIILNATEKQNYYYSISPVIDGLTGIGGNTIDYASTGVDCYFIWFFPKAYVTDTVLFDLKLASNHRLLSASLERYTNAGFINIQTIEPITNLQMTFEDLNPGPNRNLYRIRLERDDYKLIYSNEEEVFFTPPGRNLFVFPNPVYSGQELNVIDGEESTADMNIYNGSGKLLYSYFSEPAAVKVFPVNLESGIYILEVVGQNGNRIAKKIMVLKPK